MTKKLNLILHCGASAADRQQVENAPTPASTDTWHPIPHHSLINMLRVRLPTYGMKIVEEAHGLYKDALRYFGMFQVVSEDEDNSDFSMVFGLRNSHDKSFPAGLCLGSGVFVCDNLAFSAEVVLGRRHTKNIMRDLPLLVDSAVGKLVEARTTQANRLELYKNTELGDDQAAKLLLDAMDAKAINTTRVPKVWDQWKTPSHPEFAKDKTAWRLFNAFTEVYKETSLTDLPTRSTRLHGLLDSTCGVITGNDVKDGIIDAVQDANMEDVILN